ncbi:MAG: endonuclease/exonuclease/phosphatase family protein [Candidatus Hydrogenedentes bacterium]|nr:endonuclease/exonuclease/phosphatase family protein [Candidatus Hydrogenedentota bacterium]
MVIKKRVIFFMIVSVSIFLLLNSGASSSENVIKIMSFNLRYGTAPDGANHWNNRKEILVNAIKQYSPDLIGSQECLEFQAKFIEKSLPEYSWLGRGREKADEGERVAVFYKKDKWEVVEEKYFWISETPEEPGSKSWDSSCPRIVTFLKLRDKVRDRLMYFVNVHLDHKGEVARKKGAEMIVNRLKGVNDKLATIITGDFNAPAEISEPWKIFVENGYKDAWVNASQRRGPVSTWCGFKGPDYESNNRIDWILFKGNFDVVECETVLYSENGKYPSDHFPVLAVFKILED